MKAINYAFFKLEEKVTRSAKKNKLILSLKFVMSIR